MVRRKQNLREIVSWPKSPNTTEIAIITVIFRDFSWASSYMLSLLSEKLFFKIAFLLSLLHLSALLLSVLKISSGDRRVVENYNIYIYIYFFLCSSLHLHHLECDFKLSPIMR